MVSEQFELQGFEFPIIQFKEWSMAAIRDSLDCSVFPPINHENLHRPNPLSPSPSSPSLSSSSSSSSSSSFSPSDSDESGSMSPLTANSQVRKPGEAATWIRVGVEVVRSKLFAVASSLGLDKIWSFVSGAGVAAFVFVVLWFYLRARERRCRNRLKSIDKEKDEKINKLLHQIAQLNEVLVARHRILASKLAN